MSAHIKRTFSISSIMMWLGFGFLYLPIFMLVIYSFNQSRLVTLWGGFSLKWYYELLTDYELIDAFGTSLQIASISATCAAVLGTLSGIALARFGVFKGRTLFSGMLSAPFIVPEVVTGFSLLMLFVLLHNTIGWPKNRGVGTIIIAHTTIGMAYFAVLIQARLSSFNRALEEAAMDLGAKPWKAFVLVTLPLIMPAILAGWLLSFTISLDDLVISSFTSGPGAVTLPMLIYSRVRLGVTPEINALATIFVITVSVVTFIASASLTKQKG
jgi:putrescine transport system permease protein